LVLFSGFSFLYYDKVIFYLCCFLGFYVTYFYFSDFYTYIEFRRFYLHFSTNYVYRLFVILLWNNGIMRCDILSFNGCLLCDGFYFDTYKMLWFFYYYRIIWFLYFTYSCLFIWHFLMKLLLLLIFLYLIKVNGFLELY